MAAKKGLGKGLDSLIPNKSSKDIIEAPKDGVVTLKIEKVEPNRKQPRKYFDEEALEELSDSIKEYGVISPILVQKKDDYYEIIAGERRWRAAKKAGLTDVPVIIKDLTEAEVFAISLIENVQREQLNPIEEALAYKRLIDEFSLKQEELAQKVSKSRTFISNSMRLLKLDESVQQMVISGELTIGHARAMLSIEEGEKQAEFAKEVIEKKMNVRDVEKAIKEMQKPDKKTPKVKEESQIDAVYSEIENRLKDILETKVRINSKENDKGTIEIEYFSKDQLDSIIEKLEA